ncbi:HU family DNA-binding protein [Pelagibacterales bacterium SAG-MED15]|nr:HU family DNA-binding protein [Pelagibacterales bacterium SAG-MED15]
MRINLTKRDIINSIYMQIGFSKRIADNLFDDIIDCIIDNLIEHKKLKISNFGTFSLIKKNKRPGINFKTKQKIIINERNVILFKASKDFKKFVNENKQ